MSKIKYTVVGEFIEQDTLKPSRINHFLDAANIALKDTDSPIRITNYDAVNEDGLEWLQAGARAESMLLDWITDAEIGEFLFGVLSSLDGGMDAINELVGSDALVRGKGAQAWQSFSSARRDLATHLRWLQEAAERRGRPPLSDDDAQLIAE